MQHHNISILSTRPIDPSLIEEAKKLNIDIEVKSFIETVPVEDPELKKEVQKLARDRATVIFTSMNAVENVVAMVEKYTPEWKIYCIGNTTRDLVNDHFRKRSVAGSANSATELAAVILNDKDLRTANFFCGDQRREELPGILTGRGIQVKEIIVYKTIPILHKVEKDYQGILFFSPSAVDSYFSNNQTDEHCTLFAIGSTTASAIKKYTNSKIIVCDQPGKKNLVKLMQDFLINSQKYRAGKPYHIYMTQLKNDLLLRALRGETVERPPVWMMRQAGRYLPDYIKLRDKYDFFTRCRTPELATEITLQPVDQVGVDAAIIFSDILVIPQAMGVEVLMEEGKGPLLPKTIHSQKDVDALITTGADESLKYVYDALSLTKKELNGRVPLIGFAGAPWTILCYMVEGKGSKTWEKAKQFAFTQPRLAHLLLEKITAITIDYLKNQVKAGADTVQVFDSWAGVLSPADFKTFAQPYLFRIAEAMKEDAPVILFPKGCWYALKDISESAASGVGIDWCISPAIARELTQNRITIQGNFDPAKLLLPIPEIKKEVKDMINAFGVQRYIANLGHGITPNIPVDHARAFVDAVKEYEH